MKNIKNELQNIITGNGSTSGECLIKKAQIYLAGNEIPSFQNKEFKLVKSEEEERLIDFIKNENLLFTVKIEDEKYIGEGAE